VRVAKNVVVCCDGTNNSLQKTLTNVGQLSRLVGGLGGAQHVYYDAGVGVEASPNMATRIGATASRWSGLAFGTGLVENVEQAYLELVDHFVPGDRVFLFGFSRGAYTTRVLTGLLKHYGLLRPEHRGEVGEVVAAYRKLFAEEDRADDVARDRAFDAARAIRRDKSVDCPIHFLGLFDTVSSLGWAYDPKAFPNTKVMPNVTVIRHALALDERRAKFRTNRVEPASPQQDLREVWFAGVHSDVGGGYEPPRHALSRVALRWMLREAKGAGLLVDPAVEAALGLEGSWEGDEQAEQNESLTWSWRSIEYLPLPHRRQVAGKWVEGTRIYRGSGWREVKSGDHVSVAVQRRRTAVKNTFWPQVSGQIVWEA
jgi:uncharacterized protein (DUF2235 family)